MRSGTRICSCRYQKPWVGAVWLDDSLPCVPSEICIFLVRFSPHSRFRFHSTRSLVFCPVAVPSKSIVLLDQQSTFRLRVASTQPNGILRTCKRPLFQG